jgi:hypothetical protein
MTAAWTHTAMWPRTRRSVQWRTGRRCKKSELQRELHARNQA